MKERILAAMSAALKVQSDAAAGNCYIDNLGDNESVIVDGTLNLNKIAEAVARVVGPKTASFTISGESKASAIGVIIVQMSQWFQFEPMPDGKYDFTIKQELLQRLINNGYVQMQEVNSAKQSTD